MKKISSDRTGFYKKGFPVIFFAAPVLVMAVTAAFGNFKEDAFMFLVPSGMIVAGYLFFKKVIWVMADEVYDCGDSLLVRSQGQEAMIPLSNITNVDASMQVNPPRVTLRLAVLSIFGSEITFSPARSFSLNPFAKDDMIDDLIERVDQARSRRRT